MNNSKTVYSKVLDERIEKLTKEIEYLRSSIEKTRVFTKRLETKMIAKRKQLEKVQREKEQYEQNRINKYEDDFSINVLDVLYDHEENKKNSIENQINELNELKEQVQSDGAKRRIQRKIDRRNEKLKRLQAREVKVGKVQRSIILTKRILLNRKNARFSKQEAKIEYLDNKIQDKEALINYLESTGKIKDALFSKVYQYQQKRYIKKKEKQEEILETMKNSKVGIKGANALIMSKRAVNKLRSGVNSVKEQLNEMLEPANENVAHEGMMR